MDEYLKKINDLCLNAAEKRVSLQTDFLHLKYHAVADDLNLTIPVLENFLFALSLFKTRTVENIHKAKALVEKLLHFASSDGQFPVYLHEYPECKDHYLAISLIAPLYWIYKDFHQILGNPLRQRLEKALLELVNYSVKISTEKTPPYFMRIRLASALQAVGNLFNLEGLKIDGEKRLLEFNDVTRDWFIPKHLSDLIIASQMADMKFSQKFLDHLNKTWHPDLNCYAGPTILEYQAGFEPEVTLYDLFMGYLTKKFSKRALTFNVVHLHAALIQPCEYKIDNHLPLIWQGKINAQSYNCFKAEHYNFAFIEQDSNKASQDKGFAPYKLNFGNVDRLHSLTIEAPNSQKIAFTEQQKTHEFLFSLAEVPEFEDKEKCREVAFYFDIFDKTDVRIEGIKATTFQIGEKFEVVLDGFKFDLLFEIVKGSGHFMGHFMRGNRPSQIANKGKDRFAAFDYQVFLRTIRRDTDCIIKATLTLHEEVF